MAPLLSIEADIEVCIPKLKSKPVKRSFPVTSSAANKTFSQYRVCRSIRNSSTN